MKPMLFSADMVLALLDGRKTVTRRVVKDKDIINRWDCEEDGTPIAYIDWDGDHFPPTAPCRYQPGDILYAREAFRLVDFDYIDGDWSAIVQYKADDGYGPRIHHLKNGADEKTGWRPSIHMPREAARLFLRVTDVRVERLQDIDEEEAAKEGMPDGGDSIAPVYCPRCKGVGLIGWIDPETLGFAEIDCPDCNTKRKRFANMWGSTIKPKDRELYGWSANPWVWVIEFERISPSEAYKADSVLT